MQINNHVYVSVFLDILHSKIHLNCLKDENWTLIVLINMTYVTCNISNKNEKENTINV